ncbi:MAG TPA: O-antigen ligase family protein [Candidatus Paceibacterota bacterium]|jgi:O-antigen ligase/thioredoxin-like negative regulator of GroEL|nr:O-antigen ligase family protein [Candidatus Paceibacterota bacterium]
MPLKSFARFLTLAPLFLIPFFPLIVENSFFFPFITGKAFYFRILVELAFAAWVVLACIDAKYRPKWNALTLVVSVFAIVTLAADLLGVNPLRSLWSNFERMEGWIVIAHLWMFYMVTAHTLGVVDSGKRLWRNWMNVSLVASFLVACYGIAQLVGWADIHQGSSRIDASLGNAAYMAVYMLISAGFAVFLFLESKTRRVAVVARQANDSASRIVSDIIKAFDLSLLEWLYAAAAVLFSFLLIETATRGTVFGLMGGVMLALFLYAILAAKEYKKSRMFAAGIIVLIIAISGALWLARDTVFVQKSPVLSRLTSITLSEIQTQGRAYIWPMAIKGSLERPVLGWGQENFNYIFNANYNPAMYSQEQWFDRAHSVYLDWLVASGYVGLLAYLALYVFFLLAVWKSNLTIAEKSALTGLLAGYAIHNIFVFDNLASYVSFFALLGFAGSLKASTAVVSAKPPREISSDVVEYVVAPVAIIVLIFGVYMLNVRPIQENTRLIAALRGCSGSTLPDVALFQSALDVGSYVGKQEVREQIFSCAANVINAQQIPNPTKEAFFELAMTALTDQIAASPLDARIYTLGGSFLEQVGTFAQAATFLEKAHELSPAKQTIDFALGTAYVNLGQYDKAVVLLKQAYESAPSNQEAKTAYLTTLIVAGREVEAKQLFGDEPSLFGTEQVAQAYVIAKQYDKAIAIYKNLIGTSTDQLSYQFRLAQVQYSAGKIYDAVSTLKLVEANHPEYKAQIDAAIKQIQAPK